MVDVVDMAGSVRGYVIYDDEHQFGPNFTSSYGPTLAYDIGGRQRLLRGGGINFKLAKSYDVALARNECVADFLKSNVEWMWFVDADMGWEADALEQLLAVADSQERPVVGGLAFGYTPTQDGMHEANGHLRFPFPTIYDLRETDEGEVGFRVRWGYQAAVPQPCDATGAAMLVMHRSVLEAVREKHGDNWFTRTQHPRAKDRWGEDTSFCIRVRTLGLPVFVHAGVRTSHLKPIYVSESTYVTQVLAPPADEEVDVIVPVMGRPQHAEPFMRSLRASTGLAYVTAVAHEDDQEAIDAWQAAGADVLRSSWLRFAPKVNQGYRMTKRPWLLIVGSDVQFRAGWWDHALLAANRHGAEMVSTNDLFNSDVRNGRLAVHPVIRRSAADELGFTFDGHPGIIAHEGYKHWWVDAEWSTVANQRGGLVFAPSSIVEHLHPLAGKAESDDVYDEGRKFQNYDRETFTKRMARYAC